MAMIARRLGRTVVLVDKGKHPRVVIGESSTPLANLLLEELTLRYDLPLIRPLTKWGSWRRAYPEVACGLKRGFTFYHHDMERPSTSPPDRTKQLLVAASPRDEIADTHWYRADFDHFFVRQAQSIGVEYFDETDLTTVAPSGSGVTLSGRRHGRDLTLSAKFLIDASGPRGFIHRALGLCEVPLPDHPGTQALYSHFAGVGRLDDTAFGANVEMPPYPIDDAAVHHVFEGGWIWVLRFNNGITSAGIAATDKVATELQFASRETGWRRALDRVPALHQQFKGAIPLRGFTHIPRLSFMSSEMTGCKWTMLPSAAGFVDPLLSTGFPLTLLGISRLADVIEKDWDTGRMAQRLALYAGQTHSELLASAQLIGALYANMHDFRVFSALSLLYFAAASYSEAARRLGKERLARSFLLHDHPIFGIAARRLIERSRLPRGSGDAAQLVEDILQTIKPLDVAGLTDKHRRNWYPVDAEDLFRSASKLEATRGDISEMLRRCGFVAPTLAGHDAFSYPR
jgi:FADH2 O2-dependent halogenase